MKNIIPLFLCLIILGCSKHSDPKPVKCDLDFAIQGDHNFTLDVITPPDSKVEIWASDIQQAKYPMPILFLNIHNTGLRYYESYVKEWYKGLQINDYVWMQVRIIRPCGISEYKIICVKMGHGIV